LLRRKKIIVISVLLAYAIIVPVFAYMYFYKTDSYYIAAGIQLHVYETPTMKLGLYWDSACTQPVTTIDYGNMTHPSHETGILRTIWIRNEGSTWNYIRWNSTLSITTSVITESWYAPGSTPLNNTAGYDPGTVTPTDYRIFIPAYATVGTYNWTLTVCGENYY
jgi:hypothetical protein